MRKFTWMLMMVSILIASCNGSREAKTIGSIERTDNSLNEIISEDAKIDVLAEGYEWTEGPVWIESQKMLLFSDVPRNTIYKWTNEKGAEVYLTPSGYTGSVPSLSDEPGSNGLTLDKEGRLVLCQHGDRRIARMDASLESPNPSFITIADRYNGKRFNSPNDAVFKSNGDVYFTDPPYGLPKKENDSTREISFQGVYRATPLNYVSLLVDSLTRPNGIAFTPDEKTMIVANSDPGKAIWYAFDLTATDSVTNARIFYDATENAKTESGLPDGLKIDKNGNVFASGPGGVWIFNKDGKVLGKIKIPAPTANVALADDEKTLYLTSDMYLLRVKMRN
jgi:gluconolactonase